MTRREQKIALDYYLLGAGLDIDGINGVALQDLPPELMEECCRQRAEECFKDLDL